MSVLYCCVRSNSTRSRKDFPDILLPSDVISINKCYRHLCLCATNKRFILTQGQSSKIWDFIIFSNLPERKTSQLSTVHVCKQNLFLFCICVWLILSCKYWFIPVTDPNSDKSKMPKMFGFLVVLWGRALPAPFRSSYLGRMLCGSSRHSKFRFIVHVLQKCKICQRPGLRPN